MQERGKYVKSLGLHWDTNGHPLAITVTSEVKSSQDQRLASRMEHCGMRHAACGAQSAAWGTGHGAWGMQLIAIGKLSILDMETPLISRPYGNGQV
jgi:hypothetical protein